MCKSDLLNLVLEYSNLRHLQKMCKKFLLCEPCNNKCCMMIMMMMRDSMSLQGANNEQDYDAQHDAAEHPQDATCDAIPRLEISQ